MVLIYSIVFFLYRTKSSSAWIDKFMDNVLLEKNGKTICWRKLSQDDRDEIKKLTVESFTEREPIANCEGLSKPEIAESAVRLSLKCLEEGISIGAYDKANGKLCAIAMLSIYKISKGADNDYAEKEHNHSSSADVVVRYLKILSEGINEHVNNEDYVMIEITTVDDDYTRMGIMSELQKKLAKVTRDNKIKYIAGLFTSCWTQRIAEKQGYKTLKEIRYDDYVDAVLGKNPFGSISDVHKSGMLMLLDVTK